MLNYLNPYFYIIFIRNFFYDKNFFKSYKLSVPVISIGNLSVGGTGKTSIVRYLCENLADNFHIGILSRGYKRKSKGTLIVSYMGKIQENWERVGDEPFLLAKIFEKKGLQISIVVDENRVRGGEKAIKELGVNLIILDDGFQHRRLKRDLDIVLIKKEDLENKILPFGKLREPLTSLKRADAIVLTYQDYQPFDYSFNDKPIFKLYRKNWRVLNHRLEEINPGDKEFIAFCGLGDNRQFFITLKRLNLKIKKMISFPDHYDYSNFTLSPDESYITTLKDGIKLEFKENLFFLDFSIEVKGLKEFILKRLELSV
ncbi:tetraacyldisaccharide 4'-kinase [Thermodesulfobacterium hydrogeniphilum]|uniref:tetraacyldisaccharide 4'-kinase n=1 Tax=Thermodesulfobacterium hydrogeniphilum TaxID=161156 RepID=UPI000A06F470|nr:tetraacyldisaccharide 4'-kinase [Thermodesulfobacterium hydrogeniphilum]